MKQYAEVGLWSRSLSFHQIQQEFLLRPGEVMRIYKRYLTRSARTSHASVQPVQWQIEHLQRFAFA